MVQIEFSIINEVIIQVIEVVIVLMRVQLGRWVTRRLAIKFLLLGILLLLFQVLLMSTVVLHWSQTKKALNYTLTYLLHNSILASMDLSI